MKALFIGFGNAGQRTAEILFLQGEQYPGLSVPDLSVTGILTRSRGALMDPSGIQMKKALLDIRENGHFDERNPQFTQQAVDQALREWDYDVLVELSPLSIQERGEPATGYIGRALQMGKHVVTANKGPVAFAFDRLQDLAQKNQVQFRFEATVMDGAPVFSLAESTLKGCKINRISGILNSTTNYILYRMESGKSFQSALQEAQSEGFAEADPSLDVDGWDAAAKIAALSNVFMNAGITPLEVVRKGIDGITPEEVRRQLKSGNRIKLVCSAGYETGRFQARVEPVVIPVTDPLSAVKGTSACVKFETDLMSPILVVHESPSLSDTAHGVIQDLNRIRHLTVPVRI